jgi:hypothetical protein
MGSFRRKDLSTWNYNLSLLKNYESYLIVDPHPTQSPQENYYPYSFYFIIII